MGLKFCGLQQNLGDNICVAEKKKLFFNSDGIIHESHRGSNKKWRQIVCDKKIMVGGSGMRWGKC